MQLKHLSFFICVGLLSVARMHATSMVYQVEPHSKGNTITLDVTNRLDSELREISVVVLRPPSWLTVKSARVDAQTLPVDSTGHISVRFDIAQGVQRGQAGDILIGLFAGRLPVMQKTISVTIAVPAKYELAQNYPNPFNPTTTIHYQVPADGFIILKVFDLLGRDVATLVNEEQKADYYKVTFDASRLASGVYFYRLQAGEFTAVKRLLVLK